MTNDVSSNIKQRSVWMRGVYMLLLAIFYSLAEILLFAIVIFQFLLKLFTSETNERLRTLGQSVATYIYQVIQFLNFNSEHKPYPFSGWPKGEPEVANPVPVSELETDDGPGVKAAADEARD